MSNSPSGRIQSLFGVMRERQASDLFLCQGKKPAWRVFGEVQTHDGEPLTLADFREFFSAGLAPDLLDRLETQRDLDVGFSLAPGERYRLNLFYQKGLLALVARRVPLGQISCEELRLPPVVKTFAEAARGLVLVVGATGSGKSSTMAAMLHHTNANFRRHIVTIEDPIEFVHPDLQSVVTQREVGSDTLSFAASLRHVVRQSPDAIYIGELRDLESLQTALSAAMTGHLVVTTMHTVDVAQTLERILNYFPEDMRPQVAVDLSLALVGIVAQRLLRRRDGQGRVPVFETAVATPHLRRLIASRQLGDVQELLKAGRDEGMQTFTRSLVERYAAGEINLEVGAAAATNRHEFLLAVQGMETGIDTLRQMVKGAGQSELSMKRLLRAAVRHGASDLLLTVGSAPVLRIHGELQEINTPPLGPADTQALLFSILSPSQRATFEAEREIDFALSVGGQDLGETEEEEETPGTAAAPAAPAAPAGPPAAAPEAAAVPLRFRVNGFYQKGRIAAALRVIPRQIPAPAELGIPATIMDLAQRRQGLVLITGPTGSGKSTTLACLIDAINQTRSCHVITVEDPIEYVHTSRQAVIEQREVFADTHSFANALKYVLRQNPDVILIGEMRDQETMAAALTAAETGHLVFATLHTNDCAQSVDRIIDSFPPHQQNQIRSQLASALAAVVAQRLLPRADGAGRIAVFEIMICTVAIQASIREGRTHQLPATIETSSKDGMITMDRALKNLYGRNLISRQTVRLLAKDPNLI